MNWRAGLRQPGWRWLAFGSLVASGCQTTVYEPPAWINNPPIDAGFFYGIGSYVGALHPEDNQGYAMEQARGMLSRNMQSRVINNTNMRDTEASSTIRSETLVSTDYVLQNSELVSTWVDYQGRTGRRGTVWVLLRIPRN